MKNLIGFVGTAVGTYVDATFVSPFTDLGKLHENYREPEAHRAERFNVLTLAARQRRMISPVIVYQPKSTTGRSSGSLQ